MFWTDHSLVQLGWLELRCYEMLFPPWHPFIKNQQVSFSEMEKYYNFLTIFLHKNVTFFPIFSCRKTNEKYIIFHTFFFLVKYTILYKRKMGIKWFILIIFFLLDFFFFSFFFRKNILGTHDMFPKQFFARKNDWLPGVFYFFVIFPWKT